MIKRFRPAVIWETFQAEGRVSVKAFRQEYDLYLREKQNTRVFGTFGGREKVLRDGVRR